MGPFQSEYFSTGVVLVADFAPAYHSHFQDLGFLSVQTAPPSRVLLLTIQSPAAPSAYLHMIVCKKMNHIQHILTFLQV